MPPPPDVPACEHLAQRITTDPVTGHTILTPSPACMQNLGETECGHCVWVMSNAQRYIGEKHQQVPLQALVDTGEKDADGHAVLAWQVQNDSAGKPIMVSSWLNDKKPWSQVKAESVYLPAEESYAPLAASIINDCKKFSCSDSVDAFKVKLDSLNGVAGALAPSGP